VTKRGEGQNNFWCKITKFKDLSVLDILYRSVPLTLWLLMILIKQECLNITDPTAALQSCYTHTHRRTYSRLILYPASPTGGGGIIIACDWCVILLAGEIVLCCVLIEV